MTSVQNSNDIKVINNTETDKMVISVGRKIYARLLKRCGNKEIAKQALKEVLVDLYTAMETTDCQNPIEALMLWQAENKQTELLSKTIGTELQEVLQEISDDSTRNEVRLPAEPARTKQIPAAAEKPVSSAAAPAKSEAASVRPVAPVKKAENEERTVTDQKSADNDDRGSESAVKTEERAETPVITDIKAQPEIHEPRRKHSGFWPVMLILFLLVCIIGVLWTIAGLLMGIGVIPDIDLGYTWFNLNVVPLF